MSLSGQRLKKAALGFASVVVLLFGFVWLALPGIFQSQAERFIAKQSGHHLSLARPEIHPFSLSMRLRDLKLDDPEGVPLLAFRELLVDLSASSFARRAWVFDAIEIDGLDASLVRRDGATGPLNWSRLLAALANKEAPTPDVPLPRIDIGHFHLGDARFDIVDQHTTPSFASRIESVDFELDELSTLPDDMGRFKLAAKTAFGAMLDWQGEISLNPLGSTGRIHLTGVDLARLAPLLKSRLPPEFGLTPPEGIAALTAGYRLGHASGKLSLILDPLTASLSALKLRKPDAAGSPLLAVDAMELKQGRFDLATQVLAFGELALRDTHLDVATGSESRDAPLVLPNVSLASAKVDLGNHTASLGAIEVNGGKLRIRRNAQGDMDIIGILKTLAPATTEPPVPSTKLAAPWRFRVERASLAGFGVEARDESLAPAAELVLEEIGIAVDGISEKVDMPLPLKGSLRVNSGGTVGVEGTLVPAGSVLDLRLKIEGLMLNPAQAYLGHVANLDFVSGQIAAEGRLTHDTKTSRYRGSFALRDLNLNEAGTGKSFLAWKSLSSRQIEVTPTQLDVSELTLSGLDTELIIDKDKSTNFKRILRTQEAASGSAPAGTANAPPFLVNVVRLRFYNGTLDFADNSLLLPFGARIHHLRGSIGGLSSRHGAPGQLELDGEVDDYGMARAVGQVDLFNPTEFMDIRVVFRNVEMTRLTPYTATFAGRAIDSGKLSLNLNYNIKKRQLQSENQVIIDRLVLGKRVESPAARDLPLDLAVALLQDTDGRIDLGLPVSGSLDDPQFSYGQLVWKAISNVLGKIVTAPFRVLGALFGGGEKMAVIVFDAGAQKLMPPEREKLVNLAAALNKRPALTLAVRGTWGEVDRVALQDLQLRRTLLDRSGFRGDTKGDPGAVSTFQPQIQKALESLFADRFGSAELAALKEGFRSANPGQLEESLAGKVMSRLSGMLRPPRALDEKEVDALKGVHFHDVLYQRLRDKETMEDERLLQLARARGESALDALKEAGAPETRVSLQEPEKIDGELGEVPLKLELGKASS